MNINEPLGLPKGSVRAIIALILVVVAAIMGLGALAYGIASGAINDPGLVVLSVLGLAQSVVGFYFLTKPRQS